MRATGTDENPVAGRATVARAAELGYGLVGGIGEYEATWKQAYVRGPEGIVVSVTEKIG